MKTYAPSNHHNDSSHADEHLKAKTWRSIWGIRAFSLVGFAPATLWRMARKHANFAIDEDNPLVVSARGTSFVDFHNYYIRFKEKIKAIREVRLNPFMDEYLVTTGYSIDGLAFIERMDTYRVYDLQGVVCAIKSDIDRKALLC